MKLLLWRVCTQIWLDYCFLVSRPYPFLKFICGFCCFICAISAFDLRISAFYLHFLPIYLRKLINMPLLLFPPQKKSRLLQTGIRQARLRRGTLDYLFLNGGGFGALKAGSPLELMMQVPPHSFPNEAEPYISFYENTLTRPCSLHSMCCSRRTDSSWATRF